MKNVFNDQRLSQASEMDSLRPRSFRLLAALSWGIFLFLALNTEKASAQSGNERRSASYGSSSQSPAAPPASVPPKGKAVCSGMSCQYTQANEKLSLQALYAIQKLQRIDQAISSNRETEARIALGGFCRDSGEDLEACFTRFKSFQRVALLEIRQAIGKNEDTLAYLTQGRKVDGSIEGEGISFGQEGDYAPRVPEITTLSELEQAYLQGNLRPRGGRYSAQDIRKWSEQLVISNPLERTIEFKKETVDGGVGAGEKSSYRLYMTDRDADGKGRRDAAAAALYKKSQQEIIDYSKDQGIDTSDLKAHSPASIKKEDQLSYEAFTEARSIMNSKIEQGLKQGDSAPASVTSTPSVSRSVANDADPRKDAQGKSVAEKATTKTKEVKVNSTARMPSGAYRRFGDDEKVAVPPETKDSRYIRYDLHDLMKDIDQSTR